MSESISLELLDLRLQKAERDSLEPGMEFLFLNALQRSLSDVMTRIVRNVKTNLSYRGNEFKRSELQTYCDAHDKSLKAYFKSPLAAIASKPIPVPEGMRVSYDYAVAEIISLATTIGFVSYIQATNSYLKRISADLTGSQSPKPERTDELNALFHGDLKPFDLTVVTKTFQTLFSTEKFKVRMADQEFNDKVVLYTTIQHALRFAELYRGAMGIKDQVESLNSSVDRVVSHFEAKTVEIADTAYLQLLYRLLVQCANVIDKYGLLLHETQRVEHNLVLSVKLITGLK